MYTHNTWRSRDVSKLLVPKPLMSIPVFTFGQPVRGHLCAEEVVVWLGREICLAFDWATKYDYCFEQCWDTTPSCKQCSNSLQLGFLRGRRVHATPHLISDSLKLAAKFGGAYIIIVRSNVVWAVLGLFGLHGCWSLRSVPSSTYVSSANVY